MESSLEWSVLRSRDTGGAPGPAQQQAVTGEAGTLAVNNLGLNTPQAKNWQCHLRYRNFNPGTIDGRPGTNSWKVAQRPLNYFGHNGGVTLAVDGVVGPNPIRAMQRFLDGRNGINLDITGIAGPKTKDASIRRPHRDVRLRRLR